MAWRMGLGGRLVLAFLTVGFVSVAGAGALVDRTVRTEAAAKVEERLRYEVTMAGQMTASALFAPLDHGDTSLQGPIRELAAAVQTHLSVLTPDGFDVADSEVPPGEEAKSEATAPEVIAALRDGKGSAVRGEGAMRRVWVAETVQREGKVLGIARASLPMSVVDDQVRAVRMRVLQAIVGALAIGAIIALILSIGIARPVRRLAAAARRIGAGELETRVDVPAGDEIGDLGKALNDMAGNLKAMMDKVDRRNADMRRVLDTVDQGLIVCSPDGGIEAERSALIDVWFKSPVAKTRLWDLFTAASAVARVSFQGGWEQVTDGILPLELSIDQLPRRIADGDRVFALSYTPIVEESAATAGQRMLVGVFDITSQVEAERKEEERNDLLEIMSHAARDRAGAIDFLREADTHVAVCRDESDLTEVKRSLHTLKGNCAIQKVNGIADLCHEIESSVSDTGTMSPIHRELLATRWQAIRTTVEAFLGAREGIVVEEDELETLVQAILAGDPRAALAGLVAAWKLVPVEAPLGTLGERAQALADRLGKGPLKIAMEHNDVRVDRTRTAPIFSALVHVVRNAIDHGIESAEDRFAAEKPDYATLTLRAVTDGKDLVIEVGDDGGGIRWTALAAKLRARGLPAETQADLVDGLFADGMSTAEEITEISGRGVGMGALRATVEKLGGHVDISSIEGKGTIVSCRIPHRDPAPPPRPKATNWPPRGSRFPQRASMVPSAPVVPYRPSSIR